MSQSRAGSRAPEPDLEKEEVEQSKENAELWQRGRSKWRVHHRQEARSASPEARSRLPRDGRPLALSGFWQRQEASASDLNKFGGPHPNTLDKPDPPMVGWRQAQPHVWKRPVTPVPELTKQPDATNTKDGRHERKKEPEMSMRDGMKPMQDDNLSDRALLEAEERRLATIAARRKIEEGLRTSTAQGSTNDTAVAINNNGPGIPPPDQDTSSHTKLNVLPHTGTPKKRKDCIAEVQSRYPDWVQRAAQDPEWFAEAKRREEERDARVSRDMKMLEDWVRRGPVLRRYVTLMNPPKHLAPYPEPSDEDLAAVERSMSNLCSVARSEPLLVSVPCGFKLVLPSDEDTKVQGVKVAMGIMAKTFSPQQYSNPEGVPRKTLGFHADYLNSNGALELLALRAPNLNRDVHPIFRSDNFHGIPDDIYEVFLPSLHLASQFLTHAACSSFWLTLFYGQRVVDVVESAKAGYKIERIPHRAPFSLELAHRLQKEVFLPLSHAVHFVPGYPKWLEELGEDLYGWTYRVPMTPGVEPVQDQHKSIVIHINQDWVTTAKRFSQLRTGYNAAEKLRFNFIFAVLLCHEVAHASHYHQAWKPGINTDKDINEPFLFDHPGAELGRAWEGDLFGGSIQSIDHRCDGLHGVNVLVPDSSVEGLCYSVPMGYIEEIQQIDTWNKMAAFRDYNNPSHFAIPLLSIPCILGTNTVMREPLREFINRAYSTRVDRESANPNEEQLIKPLIPFERPMNKTSLYERQLVLLERMKKPIMTDQEVRALWELWWQYDSIGFAYDVEQERKWLLAENYWRLCGGKSSRFIANRMANSPDFLPERFDPRAFGSWSQAEMDELLKKREAVLGIPVAVPWDKFVDHDSDNSDDTPPHLRTEFGHHPSGYSPPESPYKHLLPERRPLESEDDYFHRINRHRNREARQSQ